MKPYAITRARLASVAAEMRYRASRTRLLRRRAPARAGGPLFPSMVQVQTLNRCNGRCVMCPYSRNTALQPEQRMSESLYAKLLEEMAAWRRGGLIVLTFQNEPLLDHRLEEFVRQARHTLGTAWQIEVTTNGSLLTPDRVATIVDAGPDVINISLNAASETTYGFVMPGLSFREVEDGVHRLLRTPDGPLVVVRYVKLKQNVREFPAFKRAWQGRGAVVIGYDGNDRLGAVYNYGAIKPPESTLRRLARRLVGPLLFATCPFPWTQVNILANGDLLMCCHDAKGATRMGNVRRDGICEIFNGEGYRDMRRSLRDGKQGPGSAVCAACVFHNKALWL